MLGGELAVLQAQMFRQSNHDNFAAVGRQVLTEFIVRTKSRSTCRELARNICVRCVL